MYHWQTVVAFMFTEPFVGSRVSTPGNRPVDYVTPSIFLVFVLVAPAASLSGIQSPTGYGPIAPLLLEDYPPLLIVRCHDQHPVFRRHR
jgi:hypothetical protein